MSRSTGYYLSKIETKRGLTGKSEAILATEEQKQYRGVCELLIT
jgi:hypothetical protein